MLRALCLGILAISTAAACKGKSDSSTVAANAPAGKVVAVSGSVEATRSGATRKLSVGADVFADDEIKTGADGAVEIELFHNHAKWSLIANKQARVDASLAWGMSKQEASAAVEHNTAAAGREAERSAAETQATAAEEAKKDMKEPAKPESMPAPKAEPMPAPAAGGAAPGGAEGGGGPPPPPPAATLDQEKAPARKDAPRGMDKGAPMAAPMAEPMRDTQARVVISPQTLADKHKDDFAKCFDAKTQATITINVRNNKATTSIAGVKNVTAKQRTCVDKAANAIDWPVKGSTFQVKVKL